jgi:hypothetical protein
VKAQQVLLWLAVGVISAVMGYTLGYLIFGRWFADLFAGSGSGQWEQSVVGDLGLHAFCAGPLLVLLGSVLATLAMLLQRVVKVSVAIRRVVLAALALVGGFVSYFPLQVLLLMGAAF